MAYILHTDIRSKSMCHSGSRSLDSIKYTVFHYTGNKTDTAKANAKFFRDNDFLNTGFINVTKVKIANHIADIVYSEAKKELIEIFEKYLKEYQPNQRTLLKKPKYQKCKYTSLTQV